jgi:outer membrane protein
MNEETKMKHTLLMLALLSAFTAQNAQAEAGDIVVRLRATNINPNESSKLGETTDQAYGGVPFSSAALYGSSTANLKVDSNTIPELDISYYVTKNIALELILALGSKHKVSIDTAGAVNQDLGKINALPPTLTAQWHFLPDQLFDPYLGAGVSYVRMMDNGLTANAPGIGSFPIRVDRSNWGGALQAGLDVNLKDGWMLNFDVKKIWVDTDVKLNLGTGYKKIDSLDINPLVVSLGVGYRF